MGRLREMLPYLSPTYLVIKAFKYLFNLIKRKDDSLNKTVKSNIDNVESAIKETKEVKDENSFMRGFDGTISKNHNLKQGNTSIDNFGTSANNRFTHIQEARKYMGTAGQVSDFGNYREVNDYGIGYEDFTGSVMINSSSLYGSIVISPYEDLSFYPEYKRDFLFIGISRITGRGIYKYIGNDFSTFSLPYEEIINI